MLVQAVQCKWGLTRQGQHLKQFSCIQLAKPSLSAQLHGAPEMNEDSHAAWCQ